MRNSLNLILMLTNLDQTVNNAYTLFDNCKDSPIECWGIKESPLPKSEMKKLFSYMKECGKTTILEVVEYTEAKSLAGAKLAKECGSDILMGTKYFDSVHSFCKNHKIKYVPFVGDVSDRPSILSGTIESIIAEAKELIEKGVYGIDLLAFRYTGDANLLIQHFMKEIDAPVCIAGSINSFERIDFLKKNNPWAFTVGSAFFDNQFGDSFNNQIEKVQKYVHA